MKDLWKGIAIGMIWYAAVQLGIHSPEHVVAVVVCAMLATGSVV